VNLIFGQDQAIGEWVARRIPHMYGRSFENFVAIGVAIDGKPAAGVVYSDWMPEAGTMQISMAADTPRWAGKGVIAALLHYPFEQSGVNKLWTSTPQKNERAIKFNLGVGFTREAILRHQYGRKNHAVICSMLANEYRKRYVHHGNDGAAAQAGRGNDGHPGVGWHVSSAEAENRPGITAV